MSSIPLIVKKPEHLPDLQIAYTLPDLPEGYFWEFRETAMHMNELSLRKETFFGFSRKIDSALSVFYIYNEGNLQGMIEPATEMVLLAHMIYKRVFKKETPLPEGYIRNIVVLPHKRFWAKVDGEGGLNHGALKILLEALSEDEWEANLGRYVPGTTLVSTTRNKNLAHLQYFK